MTLATSSYAQVQAKHRGAPPNDLHVLDGSYHVGRSLPGHFPSDELECPCPKTTCGLVAPTAAIHCPIHQGELTIRQYHHALSCPGSERRWWGPVFRRRHAQWNKPQGSPSATPNAGPASATSTSIRLAGTPGPTKRTSLWPNQKTEPPSASSRARANAPKRQPPKQPDTKQADRAE